MTIIDDAVSWYTSLPADTQRVLVAFVFAMGALRTVGMTNAVILAAAAWYLTTKVPDRASFLPWFEGWFKTVYFPKLAEKLKHELEQRSSRRSSLFDSLSDKVHSWVVGSTKGLQASLVYELLDKRIAFTDMYVCRFASINIGSRSRPSPVAFVGIHDRWYLAPWHRLDFDNVSILDEVDPSATR
jgi:hypothetical protein